MAELKSTFDKDSKPVKFLTKLGIVLVSLVTLILIWWFISIVVDSAAIPTPKETWDALVYLFTYGDATSGTAMTTNIALTLTRYIEGFVIALVLAIPIGLVLGYFKPLNTFFAPMIEVLRPIAPIVWAPVFLFLFSAAMSPVMTVVVGIFFPLLTNTIFGVQKIDSNHLDAAKTLGASKSQIFLKVIAPSAVPYIMNGIRVGLGVGWMCIVAAEMIVPVGGGIGLFVSIQAMQYANYAYVFAGIVIIAILGLLTTGVADYAYRIINKRMGFDNNE